jgi:hypothetical protein
MGRIGWVDALARLRVGDLATFESLLLEPIQNDLLNYTFLYERYTCQGVVAHNPWYIEYPEVVGTSDRPPGHCGGVVAC